MSKLTTKLIRMVTILLVLVSSLFLIGCPTIGPSSRAYKPISEWEEHALSRADRDIFPNDVLADLTKYESSKIAWPGIVQNVEINRADSSWHVQFLIEHHYYDWIEDFSIQREKIFLSPQGEGLLSADWSLKLSADTNEVRQSVGKMAIIYGTPQDVVDSAIVVKTYYIRMIDKEWFATDIFDYGRPGEPVKVLRIPQ